MGDALDCVIIGAGPAGLTAATYLGRYRRSTLVIDAGQSRASRIPASHNCPGFPSGIGGHELLARMRLQAQSFGARSVGDHVIRLERAGGAFVVHASRGHWTAKQLVLATGCEDRLPDVAGVDEAIERGLLRLCPICDAYEAIDRDIAVYGPADRAASHARFVRTFSRRVTLVPCEPIEDASTLGELVEAGIEATAVPTSLDLLGEQPRFTFDGGDTREFDVVYPFLGSTPRSQLATALGCRTDAQGALVVSRHQMTSIPGLYAIGDVVSALDQIAVATGHAAIAATAVHRALAERFA